MGEKAWILDTLLKKVDLQKAMNLLKADTVLIVSHFKAMTSIFQLI